MTYEIDDNGMVEGVEWSPTPLFTDVEIKPMYIVLYASEGLDVYLGKVPCRKHSMHLVIEESNVYQLCSLNKKAWHAGQSYWQGHNGINSFGIGIAFDVATEPTLQILDRIVPNIVEAYNIRDIVTHTDISQGRYIDPYGTFPIGRYKSYTDYGNAESGGRYTVAVPQGEKLNVRGGPGVLFEVIDKLSPGEAVKVLRSSSDWLSVIYDTKERGRRTGWVHESCLRRA